MSKVIDSIKGIYTVKELIQALHDLKSEDGSTNFINNHVSDGVELSLVEEVLTDGSKVYNLTISNTQELEDETEY